MPAINSLHELLKHELKDLYSAETQLIDALPKMVNAANNIDLKNALKQHLAVTNTHKERLSNIQQLLGEEKAPENKGFFANLFKSKEGEEHCKAMEGLVKEGDALLKEDMSPEVLDAAIIAAAQKIEHYEISSYGTARAYALQLQLTKVAGLLEATLKEEYEADDILSELGLSKINLEAEVKRKKPKAVNKKAPKASAKKAAPKKIKKVKTYKKAGSAKRSQSKTAKK